VVGPWERQFGGGGLEYFLKLRALAAPLGRGVEFVGPVFDETVLSIHYDEAAAFVYPTLAAQGEASPVAPLEALAHGLPVVVSDLACFDDYLRPGDSFAHRFDEKPAAAPETLAGILETILDASSSRDEVARAAQSRAAEFSVRDVARRYLEAFASVVPAKS
jgi:glycosyltransferase involved in cell wall biosynthesis